MANSKLYNGSICVTDLIQYAKQLHSAFNKSEKNEKLYSNIQIWINEEPDKFGNHLQIKLNPKKEHPASEEKCYIGSAKESERKELKPIQENDIEKLSENFDDLPF